MAKQSRAVRRARRHRRVRTRVRGRAEAPRLNVFRSLNHIYAQLIDDQRGVTLASASTIDRELSAEVTGKKKTEQARVIGAIIAARAAAKGIKRAVFDRGGYKYHGRVKALAEAAREGGLEF